jgi:hypothetical protein
VQNILKFRTNVRHKWRNYKFPPKIEQLHIVQNITLSIFIRIAGVIRIKEIMLWGSLELSSVSNTPSSIIDS